MKSPSMRLLAQFAFIMLCVAVFAACNSTDCAWMARYTTQSRGVEFVRPPPSTANLVPEVPPRTCEGGVCTPEPTYTELRKTPTAKEYAENRLLARMVLVPESTLYENLDGEVVDNSFYYRVREQARDWMRYWEPIYLRSLPPPKRVNSPPIQKADSNQSGHGESAPFTIERNGVRIKFFGDASTVEQIKKK